MVRYRTLHGLLASCRAEPDLEFEGLLKRQHTRVKYFQGSLMNAVDLERAKVVQSGTLVPLSWKGCKLLKIIHILKVKS